MHCSAKRPSTHLGARTVQDLPGPDGPDPATSILFHLPAWMRFEIQLRDIAISGHCQPLKLKAALAKVRFRPRMLCDGYGGYVAFRIRQVSMKACKFCLTNNNQNPTVGESHPTMTLAPGRKKLSHNSR